VNNLKGDLLMYISQDLIKKQAEFDRDEYGVYDEQLARLHLEDCARKGCLIEYGPYCINCPHNHENNCPLATWQTRHPEFANDKLAQRIKRREANLRAIWQAANKK
jgi:hypothetical protein